MTIADAPLWAQTPTAEIWRKIAYSPESGHCTGPFELYLAHAEFDPGEWHSYIGVDVPDGISIDEGRRLWLALGELLAIERLDPVPSQTAPTIAVTIPDPDGPRHLLRTAPLASGVDDHDTPLTVHVEISADPLPHGPDEMRPTVCINRVTDDSPDQAFIEIDDPDSLDQLIDSLTLAGTILRELRKKAGL